MFSQLVHHVYYTLLGYLADNVCHHIEVPSKESCFRNKDGAIGQNLDSNSHGDGEGYYIPKDDNEIQLSARQRATLAGLSLLLDVVIKTQFSRYSTVKECLSMN